LSVDTERARTARHDPNICLRTPFNCKGIQVAAVDDFCEDRVQIKNLYIPSGTSIVFVRVDTFDQFLYTIWFNNGIGINDNDIIVGWVFFFYISIPLFEHVPLALVLAQSDIRKEPIINQHDPIENVRHVEIFWFVPIHKRNNRVDVWVRCL